MRNGFGRLAQELRAARRMSQKDFSTRAQWSSSFTSNLEFGRAPISDDVVARYISILGLPGPEAHKLRMAATASDKVRLNQQREVNNPELLAFLDVVGDKLSEDVVERIKSLAESASGEDFSFLTLASTQMTGRKRPKKSLKHDITLSRFVEIALIAQHVRDDLAGEMDRLDLGVALETLSAAQVNLDYQVLEELPKAMQGAYAVIVGSRDGHFMLFEEARFAKALNGVVFLRHAIAHELGHHYLHPHLLDSERPLVLPPSSTSKIQTADLQPNSSVEQVIDSIEELEAEIFGLFFLVPWFSFFKGTSFYHLARDFGEQQSVVEGFGRYFRNPKIADEFKMQLWASGNQSHPLFHQP